MTKINGYEVKEIYAGIMTYVIYKNSKEIGTCWSIADVAKLTQTDADTVNRELWDQRYN